jgi:hypothetical protein
MGLMYACAGICFYTKKAMIIPMLTNFNSVLDNIFF